MKEWEIQAEAGKGVSLPFGLKGVEPSKGSDPIVIYFVLLWPDASRGGFLRLCTGRIQRLSPGGPSSRAGDISCLILLQSIGIFGPPRPPRSIIINFPPFSESSSSTTHQLPQLCWWIYLVFTCRCSSIWLIWHQAADCLLPTLHFELSALLCDWLHLISSLSCGSCWLVCRCLLIS